MNILQVHKYFYKRDGASNYMFELSEILHKKGHNIIPFSTVQKDNEQSPYQKYFVPFYDLSDTKKLSLGQKIAAVDNFIYSHKAKMQLKELLDNEAHIDVAHIHNIYHHITPSILPELKKRGIKIVMTLHDYKLISPNYSLFHHGEIKTDDKDFWYIKGFLNKSTKDSYAKSALTTLEMIFHHKIMNYYKKYVDVFIAPSQFIKNICVQHGWPQDKIIHVPHPAFFQKNYHYKDGDYVAYVGRLSQEKGVHHLIQAAERLPNVPFKIIGDGPQHTYLKSEVKRLSLNNVIFTGFQSGKSLQSLINGARLLVLPSIWYENYPLSVLEAKSAPKVVLASDIGGLPEMLPKELLFAPGDVHHMTQQINEWFTCDVLKRERMANRLHKQVLTSNDPDVHVEQMLNVYQK